MSDKKPVVVVTGSSTGIGLELCLCLSRMHFSVVATLRSPPTAPSSLRDSGCDIQPLDVTCDESAGALTSYLSGTYGGCDVLVNNAGWGMPGTLETLHIEEAKRVFEVNVWGVMRMCQVLVPLMRLRGGGLVVTVSSTSGWRGLPCVDIYTASKHAVEGMMDSFRYSVQKDNVKVVMVNPGPTATEFSKRFQSEGVQGSRPADEVPTLPRLLVNDYLRTLEKRNAEGQSAADCAKAIAAVVDRELRKDATGGAQHVPFSNPTSQYGEALLKMSRCVVDGSSGPVHDHLFQQSNESLQRLQKELGGKQP